MMFGFSISKLLVLALIVAAVMIGYRLFGRGGAPGGTQGGNQDRDRRGRDAAAGPDAREAVDTEYDAETDTYVVRDRNAKQD